MNTLKQIHVELQKCWNYLRGCENQLDAFEAKLVELEKPPMPRGRETPFFIQQRFAFRPRDFEPQSAPLVHSAGRTTRVVRLTATALWYDSRAGFVDGNGPVPMRPTPGGLCFDNGDIAFPFVSTELFEFDWTFSLGSTERRYTNGIGISGYNGRTSLGNHENNKSLLFNEKYPLVLQTNEFLTFTVKPLVYNMNPERVFGEDDRFFVDVQGVAYRTFND
jgi:hypothetical protein